MASSCSSEAIAFHKAARRGTGRGREQVAQILRTLVERVVADVRRQKHRNGQHHRDEQRVEERELELFCSSTPMP